MELSREQQTAFDAYITGNNVFITGPGGSGKSALIKRIVMHAHLQFKRIRVCAMTGCAAVLLGCKATTLHSWAGIGLGKGTLEHLVTKIKKNLFLRKAWTETQILVVDEVSMLSLQLFEMLNEIGRQIRKNGAPFGGIQLIFSGDFFQLPPIGERDNKDTQRFCFESVQWNRVFHRDNQIQLVKIFRQTDDVYATILNQIRQGKIKRKSVEILNQYVGRERNRDLVVEPTKLYPTRQRVDQINGSKMTSLTDEEHVFPMKFHVDLDTTREGKIQRFEHTEQRIQMELDLIATKLICDKDLKLKVGAQVMSIVNIQNEDSTGIVICNGSQGIVTSFTEGGYPRVQFNNGVEKVMGPHIWESDIIPGIGVSQVPLILAWALTIHKSQGATMDAAEIDAGSGIFECGQTYVALSRVKSLEGLYLTSFDVSKIYINAKVADFYEALTEYFKIKHPEGSK